jgi:hypothetical protein
VLPDPEFVRRGALALAFNADDRLFLAMKLRRQPRDGRGRVRDRLLEPRRVVDQLLEGGARGGDLLAQFLDLALGGENAPRLGLLPAGDDMAPAEDVAVERRHRIRHGRRNPRRGLERLGDQRAAHHGLHGLRKRPAHANHRRQGDGAGRNLSQTSVRNPRRTPVKNPREEPPCGTFVRNLREEPW